MNQSELIKAIQDKANLSQAQIKRVLDAQAEIICYALIGGGEVQLHAKLGKLKCVERAERKGTNPITGYEMTIPAKNAVTFKAAKSLKDAVN